MMKGKGVVLTGVGFVVGVAEALLFYNLGQAQGEKFKFRIPPGKELFKTVGVLAMTSALTTVLFMGLEIMMEGEEDNRLIADTDKKKEQ